MPPDTPLTDTDASERRALEAEFIASARRRMAEIEGQAPP